MATQLVGTGRHTPAVPRLLLPVAWGSGQGRAAAKRTFNRRRTGHPLRFEGGRHPQRTALRMASWRPDSGVIREARSAARDCDELRRRDEAETVAE